MEKGYFVISDISGYSLFLNESELDHANDIIKSIIENITQNVISPLRISNFQGDAILTYAPAHLVLIGQTLVHQIENIYFDFKQHLKKMHFNTTCQCRACKNIPGLDLKFFVHYGEYAIQKIDKREELIGADVILVHRLMKNDVVEKTGLKAYALITESAAQELGVTKFCEKLEDYEGEFESVGHVKAKVYCLHTAWDKELKSDKDRVMIDPENEFVRVEVDVPYPPAVVWDYVTKSDFKQDWMGMDNVTHTPAENKGYGKGSKYHCAHAHGDFVYEVKDWRPFDYMTVDGLAMGSFTYRQMIIIKPTRDGSKVTVLLVPRNLNFFQGIKNKMLSKKMKEPFQQTMDNCWGSLGDYVKKHQTELVH